MVHLCAEMIDGFEQGLGLARVTCFRLALVDVQFLPTVAVGRIKVDKAFGAVHSIAADFARAEGAVEMSQYPGGKTQRECQAFRNFAKPRIVARLLSDSSHLDGFFTRDVARSINAVNSDIAQRAAAKLSAETDVWALHILAIAGRDRLDFAEAARSSPATGCLSLCELQASLAQCHELRNRANPDFFIRFLTPKNGEVWVTLSLRAHRQIVDAPSTT